MSLLHILYTIDKCQNFLMRIIMKWTKYFVCTIERNFISSLRNVVGPLVKILLSLCVYDNFITPRSVPGSTLFTALIYSEIQWTFTDDVQFQTHIFTLSLHYSKSIAFRIKILEKPCTILPSKCWESNGWLVPLACMNQTTNLYLLFIKKNKKTRTNECLTAFLGCTTCFTT